MDEHEPNVRIDRTAVLFVTILLVPILFIVTVRWTTAHFAPRANSSTAASATATLAPIPAPIPVDHAHFETGVSVNSLGCPTCTTAPYGPDDKHFSASLVDMRDQTAASWVEIEIDLWQNGINATTVTNQGPSSTPPSAVANAVQEAHADGLHVFIVAHLKEGSSDALNWCGPAVLTSASAARAWFASYWQAIEPYLGVAQQYGAEQFSLANECYSNTPGMHVEQAPTTLWHTLITQARSIYHYSLGYNMNWQVQRQWTAQPWMRDPGLSFIGVSMYQPLTHALGPLSLAQIEAVWKHTFLPELDDFSMACGNKPIILSEIGYWNDMYALYGSSRYGPFHPLPGPPDPQLQADAYHGAISSALGDPRIDGVFIWEWGDPRDTPFTPKGLPAAQVLRTLYQTIAHE